VRDPDHRPVQRILVEQDLRRLRRRRHEPLLSGLAGPS
jgi:hypothetical protein